MRDYTVRCERQSVNRPRKLPGGTFTVSHSITSSRRLDYGSCRTWRQFHPATYGAASALRNREFLGCETFEPTKKQKLESNCIPNKNQMRLGPNMELRGTNGVRTEN